MPWAKAGLSECVELRHSLTNLEEFWSRYHDYLQFG